MRIEFIGLAVVSLITGLSRIPLIHLIPDFISAPEVMRFIPLSGRFIGDLSCGGARIPTYGVQNEVKDGITIIISCICVVNATAVRYASLVAVEAQAWQCRTNHD